MGNSFETPNRRASNTDKAYKGTIDNLFERKLAFQLFNPVYGFTVFVSDKDKIAPDFLVESHEHSFEERNIFYLQKINGVDWNGYVLYHSKSGQYLFVSNDKYGKSNYVEAHPYLKEERNCFIFQHERDFLFKIYNPKYNQYMFVSNVRKGSKYQNAVIMSQQNNDQERNLFEIQLIHPQNDIDDNQDNDEKMKSENDDDDDDDMDQDMDQDMDRRVIKDTPVKKDSDDDDSKLCIVCMENNKDHVIIPCGHICLCINCKQEYYDNDEAATCPLCQCKIEKIMKTYQ